MDLKNKKSVRIVATVAAAAACCFAAPAHAQWEVTPSIYLSGMYTDNVGFRSGLFLFDDSTGPTEDFAYTLSPSIAVRHNGPRFTLNSNYQYRLVRFVEFDGNDQEFQNFNLTSNYEVIRDRFGVDFNANRQQQVIDRALGIGGTTANRIGNLSDFSTYSVQPYLNFELGQATTGRVTYRLGLNEFVQPQLIDSTNDQLTATITSTLGGGKFSLGATYTDSGVEFDTGRDISLQRIAVNTGYRLSPRTQLVLDFGEDTNDIGAGAIFGDVQGEFWMAGLVGSIGTGTNYEVRVGEQFFGDSLQASVDRTRGRLTLSLSYIEQATTFGGGAINPQALLSFATNIAGIDLPNATQDVFISNRLTFGATYTMTRSSFAISVFNDDRDFLSGLDDDERSDNGGGAQVSWSWEMSRDMRLTLTGLYQRFTIRRTQDTPEDIRAQIIWRRTLFEGAFVDARLIHNQRSSDVDLSFEENTLQIGFGYEF